LSVPTTYAPANFVKAVLDLVCTRGCEKLTLSGFKRVDIVTWSEVQLPLRATKDLFALQMWDPGGGNLHP
jgi:hypothetical protein